MSAADYQKPEPKARGAASTALLAIQIADKFQGGAAPSIQYLMCVHQMSRATAYRWVSLFKQARGIADA
ncbi:MAG: hypothetical protein JSR63_07920 [Proteobacteria bacterium]|nr:hypothetical protein [Pseudomonadota bacterium]